MSTIKNVKKIDNNTVEIITEDNKYLVEKNNIDKIMIKRKEGKYILYIYNNNNFNMSFTTNNKRILNKAIKYIDKELSIPDIPIPTFLEKKEYIKDSIYYNLGFIWKDKIYDSINFELHEKINTRNFRSSYYYETHYITGLEDLLKNVFKISKDKVNISKHDIHFRLGSYFNIKDLNEALKEEGLFAVIQKYTGLKFKIDEFNLLRLNFLKEINEIKEDIKRYKEELKENIRINITPKKLEKINKKMELSEEIINNTSLTSKKTKELEENILLQIENIMYNNSQIGKETLNKENLSKSGFLKKLKEVEQESKLLIKILKAKTTVNKKYLSTDIEKLVNKLNDMDIFSISNDYLTFNEKNNYMEFKINVNKEIKKLLEKTKEVIEKGPIHERTKKNLINKLENFEKLLENFDDKVYNISVIRRVLGNKSLSKKYPVFNLIKSWLNNKLEEYKEYFVPEISKKIKQNISKKLKIS